MVNFQKEIGSDRFRSLFVPSVATNGLFLAFIFTKLKKNKSAKKNIATNFKLM